MVAPGKHHKHQHHRIHLPDLAFVIMALFLLNASGCAGDPAKSRSKIKPPPDYLSPVRYSVQVGAFSNMSNALRLIEKLQSKGLNAYHFRHDSGLFKVRFGNYATRGYARRIAEDLRTAGMIAEYYIVGPEHYPPIDRRLGYNDDIRNRIVKSAQQYIGVPYQWGGESPETGFDCSGLTMVVYQLNGLDLPRSARQQWKAGRPVQRSRLERGDLVFFATARGRRVSHVGIYMGNGRFLHAPRRGRKITISSLSNTYYNTRYLGARSYL